MLHSLIPGKRSKSELPVSVLLFHPANAFAGAERTTTNIVTLSDHSKLRFVVVTGPKAFRGGEEDKLISLFDLGISNGFAGLWRAIHDARVLCGVARREGCTIALGMLHYGALVAVLMRFLSLFRIIAIASPRTPTVLGIHHHVGRTGLLAFKWRSVVNFFFRFSNRIIVASEGLKNEAVRVYGANPNRVFVIPNGIDAEELRRISESVPIDGGMHKCFRFVSFGRLAPEKDLDTLITAFARIRTSVEASLWIIGEGPERERLQQLASDLDISGSVEFLGFQPDPFAYVKSADVFVHTALFEGFGNVILEAMACGVPVIATDCDFGPREIIRNRENGMLVPVSEPTALAETMLTLCNHPDLREELIRSGYSTLGRYEVARMVEAYERAIMGLTG